MKTLYLTASRTDAALYSETSQRPFHLVERLRNPMGRAKEARLGGDRPGRVFASANRTRRHALENAQQHHRETARRFAVRIAKKIDRYLRSQEFDGLVMTATPELLGLLRHEMSVFTKRLILEEIPAEFVVGADQQVREKIHASRLKRVQK